MNPYAIISDTHNHNWSAFSTPLESGVNSRLNIILDEVERCAETLAKAGGRMIYHGGDLFHVRGSVAPSVLNPTKERYRHIHEKYGVQFAVLGGNHDFEGKHSTRLGNAVAALECDWVSAIDKACHDELDPHHIIMIPWHESIAQLRDEIDEWANAGYPPSDLIIHAPIDGVIHGIPPHGLTAAELAGYGFKRVFAGHYHHHKDFGNGVYSIGALTHHTWSDVGSKAGFLIVTETDVTWHASHAPSFIDITSEHDPAEVELMVPDNYVRAKITSSKASEIEDLRKWLTDSGALGVVIQVVKEPARVRAGGMSVKAGSSIEASIGDYIKAHCDTDQEEITRRAMRIFAEAA